MRGLIREKVLAGWSRQEIVDNLVAQYGERILAAPTKQGFNLTAWLTPAAVVLLGGTFVGYLVVSWAGRRPRRRGAVEVDGVALDDEPCHCRSRLARELEEFEG
jgi:cytochrome c-type biogenesis protein CcmH